MKFSVVVLVLLGCQALASTTDVATQKSTMGKVVKILQNMMKKSAEDGEKERDLYAKFKCYCDDNEAEKTEEIREAKDTIKMLNNDLAKVRASSGTLSTEVAELKQGIAANEAARKTADEQREEAHEHFLTEEEDMKGAMGSMESAIAALSALTGDKPKSLLQSQAEGGDQGFMSKKLDLPKLQAGLKKAMTTVSVWLTQKQKRLLNSFIQAPAVAGIQISQSSDSRSIVNILQKLFDSFKENLKNTQSAEKAAAEAHDKFMKLKDEEHKTMTEALEEKEALLGENEDEMASLTEQIATTEEDLASAEEFLAKLMEMCAKKAKEYEGRKLLRANEEAAISEAISILNSDAAFEAFGKVKATKSGGTGLLQGPAFLQVSMHNVHRVASRSQIINLIRKAAQNQQSLKIAKIAALLEAGNPFDSVLKEIDTMIEVLDTDQKFDDEQKDWCDSEMKDTKKMKETKEDKITDLEASIEELTEAIHAPEDGLLAQIESTEKDIKENHESKEKETAERHEENQVYQTTVKNCKTAEELLKKAIKALKRFYDQFEDLMQEDAKEDPEPPDTFEGGAKGGVQTKKGGKVIDMLEFITEETKKEEDDAHKEEEEAVEKFEERMKELEEELKELQESLVELKETLAEKQKLLGEKKEDLTRTKKDLKAVKKYLKSITPGCDFIDEHYDERKESRGKEKDALKEAVKLLKDTPAYKAAKKKEEEK